MPSWLSGRPVTVDHGGPTGAFERFPAGCIEQPIVTRFFAIADRFGDKVAIDDGAATLTYRQVRARVTAMAARIADATPNGGPVAAILDNTAEFPVVFLACLMTGRPIVPVDAGYPADHQRAILRDSGAVTVVLGPGLSLPDDLLRDLATVVPVAAGDTAPVGDAPSVSQAVDAPAGVIYTSGSTGRPKGVAFSQRQFLTSLAEYIDACHIGPDDRLVGLASLGGASVREALAALLTGATFHIADLRQHGINAVFRTLKATQCTILAFVPSVLRSFTARADAADALASLRIVDLFGELVTADAVAALRGVLPATCHIRVSLGSTETMVLFHWFVPRDFEPTGAGLPCGYLARHASIRLLDDADEPAGPGCVGELVVRGRAIASGMWAGGAVLPGPFRQDPDDPSARILHTGDLIRLREDGLAEFAGRRDRRVKIRGLRADPGDVEALLHRLPGVLDCAVVTRTAGDDTVFLAYVVANETGPAAPHAMRAAIRAALREDLPPHMMPGEIHLLDSIPRLPNFKPDLLALTRREAPDPR
ncbi:MAG: AMP-binding protein [Acetobacteraceae bacterium]